MKVSIGMYISGSSHVRVVVFTVFLVASAMKKPHLGWVLRACNIG